MKQVTFEPTSLAGIKLKNHIIRSATYEAMADEKGCPNEKLKKLYINLAKGEVGAIITGNAGVQANGKASLFNMTMIDSDDKISAYREITNAVHEYGTPIIMQIVHCGRQTRSKITGLPTVAPSALRDAFFNEDIPKELSDDEINEVIDNFVAAIIRTKQAGFDGVQLHLAHGYLLAEFLSSHSNRRKDRWGGSTENKFRIVGEIFKRAKEKVGEYPILVKMNAHDGRRKGMRIEEATLIAQMLEKSGCAAIEVSCGCFEDHLYTIRSEKLPAEAVMEYSFQYKKLPGFIKAIAIPFAKTFMIQPNIPVIVVGGINNIDDINNIIENSRIDFVAMCRPFIIEPDIVSKFKKGTQAKSKCIMCNYCGIILEEQPLKCHYGRLPKTKHTRT
jgi:2,4-dienoyl-CoA reductase-like NADH-dependent reductase (Old Yellow Enzyme family)